MEARRVQFNSLVLHVSSLECRHEIDFFFCFFRVGSGLSGDARCKAEVEEREVIVLRQKNKLRGVEDAIDWPSKRS